MEKEVAEFISSHLAAILSGLGTFIVALVATTWAIAKQWYQRPIELANAKCEGLEQQLDQKDCYIHGVMEVMNQRLALAQEEPVKLQQQIVEKEKQLEELTTQNKSLLETIDSSKGELELSSVLSDMSVVSLRSSLRTTMRENAVCFPNDRRINRVNNLFRKWDIANPDKETDLFETASLLYVLFTVQTHHSVELDYGLKNCFSDLSSLRRDTYSSLSVILDPVSKKDLTKNVDMRSYLIRDLPFYQLEHYIDLAKKIEEQKKKDDEE